MKILIIEDEKPAAEKLKRFIKRFDASFEIIGVIDSVAGAVYFLYDNPNTFDLAFMDIELRDGKSFQIIDQAPIHKPVIFTTAYDNYALEAFRLNSIAYLLKPFTYEEFTEALQKLIKLKEEFKPSLNLQEISLALAQLNKKAYKERFMVKLGDHLKSVNTQEVAYFFADGRTIYLITNENRRFIIDYRLEDLEELLNPSQFFRVNRSFILRIDSITAASSYTNSRLKISVNPTINKEIIVSREKVNDFKNWFSGQ